MANFNFNKVILGGRLTADPELRQTTNGSVPVVSFRIAVNRGYAAKNDQGEREKVADFINCVAWRTTAEYISRYFRKGSSICVVGSIQNREWVDAQGQKRYATDIVVEEATFVDSASESRANNPQFGGGSPLTGTMPYTGSYQGGVQNPPAFAGVNPDDDMPKFEEIANDDDLPF